MAERISATDSENPTRRHQEDGKFPEDPEERLAALLAAFNFGPKAVTLLLLPEPDSYISPQDLAREFKQLMAGTEMGQVREYTAPDYCHGTLCPIGLVARKYTFNNWGKEELVGFGLSPAGQHYGLAASCLVLEFEQEQGFSLFQVLGQTASSSSHNRRAPMTRARILELLVQEQQPQREVDIIQKLGIVQPIVEAALIALKKAGIINYQAVTSNTGQVQVEYARGDLPVEQVALLRTDHSLTQAVAKACQQLALENLMISQATVFERLPESFRKDRKTRTLRGRVSRILSNLAEQGFLKRGEFTGGEKQSIASINQKGAIVVRELIEPLRKLTQDNPLTLAKVRGEVIPKVMVNLNGYARTSAKLYYPFSRSSRMLESQANRERVLALIAQRQGITAVQLAAETELNNDTIRNYLRAFFESGQIESDKVKGVFYWRLIPNRPTPA